MVGKFPVREFASTCFGTRNDFNFIIIHYIIIQGICSINVSKQLPEDGFQKDLFTGVMDMNKVSVITYIQRVIEHVFMDALAHPGTEDDEDCSMIKTLLLPGLRSFCSALKGVLNIFHDS